MMNNKLKLFLISFVSLFMSVAYAANPNFSDPSKSIMVKKNTTTITLTLKSNPTTGYSWYLKHYDSQLIRPISHTYVAPDKQLAGPAGYEKWVFKISPGAFTVPQIISIGMTYARPWDLSGSNTSDFNIVTQP